MKEGERNEMRCLMTVLTYFLSLLNIPPPLFDRLEVVELKIDSKQKKFESEHKRYASYYVARCTG